MGIVPRSDSLAVVEGSEPTENTDGTVTEDALIVSPVDGRDTVKELVHSYHISHSLQTRFDSKSHGYQNRGRLETLS